MERHPLIGVGNPGSSPGASGGGFRNSPLPDADKRLRSSPPWSSDYVPTNLAILAWRRFSRLSSPSPSPLLSMAALSVEHLKVMAALTVEPACAFNLLLFFFDLFEGQISN